MCESLASIEVSDRRVNRDWLTTDCLRVRDNDSKHQRVLDVRMAFESPEKKYWYRSAVYQFRAREEKNDLKFRLLCVAATGNSHCVDHIPHIFSHFKRQRRTSTERLHNVSLTRSQVLQKKTPKSKLIDLSRQHLTAFVIVSFVVGSYDITRYVLHTLNIHFPSFVGYRCDTKYI